MGNSLGKNLIITSFGESHGSHVGIVIDGFPSNYAIDFTQIQNELDRRKPGQTNISSDRKEDDIPIFISGIFEGKTTGAPICILIENKNQNSKDYTELKNLYRPSHADKVYDQKYINRDYRGGGRSSARITAPWVAAGALAKQFLLNNYQIKIQSVVNRVKHIGIEDVFNLSDWSNAETNAIKCPETKIAESMIELIESAKIAGDTVGGTIATRISNCPISIGEPVFDKLNADLSKAMFSINATKGIEFGDGFSGTYKYGSERNDAPDKNTNNEGGIIAGISNGNNIEFTTAFKPVSSIKITQRMENQSNEIIDHQIQGRHDPCVLPRAIPIVESLTAIIMLDHIFSNLKNIQK
jgi:chorismate synthase